MEANTFAELEELLREYWHWAGRRPTRKVAAASGGAFSHATVSKLLNDKPQKPPLKHDYVLGVIRGCGGNEDDQRQWVTAWRRIDQKARNDARSRPKPTPADQADSFQELLRKLNMDIPLKDIRRRARENGRTARPDDSRE